MKTIGLTSLFTLNIVCCKRMRNEHAFVPSLSLFVEHEFVLHSVQANLYLYFVFVRVRIRARSCLSRQPCTVQLDQYTREKKK